jgi:hypothetical protein
LFSVGDDVVARLDGAPYNLDEGAIVGGESRPSWAVATVAAREWRDRRPHYLLSFLLDDDRCLCLTAESSIEGLA